MSVQLAAAKVFSIWEAALSVLIPQPSNTSYASEDAFALSRSRIEAHYFVNNSWFDRDDYLLANADRLNSVPGIIIQGRYDMVCPLKSAWDLHKVCERVNLCCYML
jgi:proline iminopeptidase